MPDLQRHPWNLGLVVNLSKKGDQIAEKMECTLAYIVNSAQLTSYLLLEKLKYSMKYGELLIFLKYKI